MSIFKMLIKTKKHWKHTWNVFNATPCSCMIKHKKMVSLN